MQRPSVEHVPSNWKDPAAREAFRAELMARIPRWYSPWLHLASPSLVGLGIAAACLALLHDVRLVELMTVPVVLLAANAFEWRVHRDLLHHRVRFAGLAVLYDRHTPELHRVFVTEDMAIRSPREFRLVLVPAYGIAGIAVADLPLAAVLWLAGQHNVAALFLATSLAYFASYEMLHLSYHLAPDSLIGRNPLIRVLRRHHATHHSPELMQRWNFNVTLPLWDWVRGTIYRGDKGAR